MAMVCPQCSSSFDQLLECPRCAARLVYKEEGAPLPSDGDAPWQQTSWGRALVGLMLAQGVYHGLKHLFVAVLLASDSAEQQELLGSLPGFLLLQALQVLGLLIGATLAGAAQRQGALFGLVLGVWNGVILVAVQPDPPEELAPYVPVGLPLAQALLGAIAGWAGSSIWSPLSPVSVPGAAPQVLKRVNRQRRRLFAGPVHWVRVSIGTVVAVVGTLTSAYLLDRMVQFSQYELTPGSQQQTEMIRWEISALLVALGGVIAGAMTPNGLKQGLVVGIATTVLLVGIKAASPTPPSFVVLTMLLFGPVVIAILGGGFGSQLLPPVRTVRKRLTDS